MLRLLAALMRKSLFLLVLAIPVAAACSSSSQGTGFESDSGSDGAASDATSPDAGGSDASDATASDVTAKDSPATMEAGDAGSDTGPSDAGDAGTDGQSAETGASDGSMDAARDVTTDAPMETGPETGAETGSDATADALGDAPAESGPDAATDAGCTQTLAVFGGSSAGSFAATWSAGAWSTASSLGGNVANVAALVPYGTGYLGAVRETTDTLDSSLGAPFSQPAQIAAATTKGTPVLATIGSAAHVVYWGSDNKFYHGTYSGGAWDSASDPVGGSGASQSFGSSAPTLAAVGTELVVGQTGTNATLYAQSWTGGTWATATAITGASVEPTVSPTLVALTGGSADLLVVAASQTNDVLYFATRTSGTWSTLAMVSGTTTYTSNPVALAALPGGKAVMVYEGGDSKPYVSVFDGASWSAPAALVSGTNPTLWSPPQITSGACGNDATVAFVPMSGTVQVTSLSGGTWSAPSALVGSTGAFYASIAAH
jgi:hypothetical protein